MSTTNWNNPGSTPPGYTADAPGAGAHIPGQPGMPMAGYGQPMVAVQSGPGRQGLAIASLVLGIVAAVFCLIPIVGAISLVLAPIGLVLGLIGWHGARKGRREGTGKAIAGVVLSVISFAVALLMMVALASAVNEASDELDRAFGNSTEQVLAEDLGVVIGEYTADDLGFGVADGSLAVTLTNKANERQSFDVKVEAIAADGTRIGTDVAFVSDLGAGQSDVVQMFEFESSKDAAQLQDASFKVIEASAY